MSENLFGLTVATDKGLDDLQCQRLLSENRRYQEFQLVIHSLTSTSRRTKKARNVRHIAK